MTTIWLRAPQALPLKIVFAMEHKMERKKTSCSKHSIRI